MNFPVRVGCVAVLAVGFGCASPADDSGSAQQQLDNNGMTAQCGGLTEEQCARSQDCVLEQRACTDVCRPDSMGGCQPCPALCRPRNPTQPPPDACAGLQPDECQARAPFCETVQSCRDCDPQNGNTMCSPTCTVTCRAAPPTTTNRCANLSERACNQASGCQGVYRDVCHTNDPFESTGMNGNDDSTGCAVSYAGCVSDSACQP